MLYNVVVCSVCNLSKVVAPRSWALLGLDDTVARRELSFIINNSGDSQYFPLFFPSSLSDQMDLDSKYI